MAKEKVLNEKMDINTPFKDFVRKFKKQKTAIVAMCFIIALAVLAVVSTRLHLMESMNMIIRRLCRGPVQLTGLERMNLDVISSQESSAEPGFP